MDKCCVKLRGSVWLVVGAPCPHDLQGHLGTLYGTKETAFSARDPGEIVVELRLADPTEGSPT